MAENDGFQQVAEGVYYFGSIDRPVSGSYVIVGERVYLVETSTEEVASLLLSSLGRLGIRKQDVAGVIATHIHLDHSGGAGWLVRQMPWVKVYVHPNGARHLMDPSRLLASADKVYGGREEVLRIHGSVHPVPEDSIVPVETASIDAGGGVALRIYPAPGHAPHHLMIFEEAKRLAFVGELPGHYFPGHDILCPTVTPPGFDYEETLRSLERLRGLSPEVLCFSQFGFTDRAAETIALAEEQVSRMHQILSSLHGNGVGVEGMVMALMEDRMFKGISELSFAETMELFVSSVMGFLHYFQKNQ